MNRLVIVGNGFDLAHGLRTTYIDFLYEYFIESITLAINNSDYRGYKDILIEIDTLTAVEFDMIVKLENLDNLEKIKRILNFEDTRSNKVIIINSNLLKDICGNIEETNWVDIEKIYSDFIIYFNQKLSENQLREDKIDLHKKIKSLNDEFEFMKLKIEKYLRLVDDKFVHSIEQTDYIDKLLFGKSNRNQIDLKEDRIFFLSFNYTNLIRRYIDESKSNFTLKFIHGNVKHEEPILFGYGDTKSNYYQIIINENHTESMRFFKSMITTSNDSYESFKSFINSAQFEVLIAGHSCGSSDSYILSEIINHNNCYSIKLLHYLNKEGKSDFHQKYTNLTRHFKNTEFNKEKIEIKSENDVLTKRQLLDNKDEELWF